MKISKVNNCKTFDTELSVIIPCLNEEKNIEKVIKLTLDAILEFKINSEIIIIDDGSTDKTLKKIQIYANRYTEIRLVKHKKNLGIGTSFSHGVKIAKGQYITMIPGDNENSLIENLRYFFLRKDVDIIIPFVVNKNMRSKSRRFISAIYNFIINVSFGVSLNYTNGTVIYNKKLLEFIELRSTGFFFQTELLIKLIRCGFLYAEVPQMLAERQYGKSKALTLRSLARLVRSYLYLVNEIHIKRATGRRDNFYPPGTASEKRYRKIKNYNV